MKIVASRPLGPSWVVDRLWERLGIGMRSSGPPPPGGCVTKRAFIDKLAEVADDRTAPASRGVRRDRFVTCHNPERAAHDAAIRANIGAEVPSRILRSDGGGAERRRQLYGQLGTKAVFKRLLRGTGTAKLRTGSAAIAAIAVRVRFDSKCLVRTDDETHLPRTSRSAAGGNTRENGDGATCGARRPAHALSGTDARTASAPVPICVHWCS